MSIFMIMLSLVLNEYIAFHIKYFNRIRWRLYIATWSFLILLDLRIIFSQSCNSIREGSSWANSIFILIYSKMGKENFAHKCCETLVRLDAPLTKTHSCKWIWSIEKAYYFIERKIRKLSVNKCCSYCGNSV